MIFLLNILTLCDWLQYWYSLPVVDSRPSGATSVVLVRAQDCQEVMNTRV